MDQEHKILTLVLALTDFCVTVVCFPCSKQLSLGAHPRALPLTWFQSLHLLIYLGPPKYLPVSLTLTSAPTSLKITVLQEYTTSWVFFVRSGKPAVDSPLFPLTLFP